MAVELCMDIGFCSVLEGLCCMRDRHNAVDADGKEVDSVQAVSTATAASAAMVVKRTDFRSFRN
jgi:hypothetical protein